MPQVPYQPFPTATPTAPGEKITEATPGAAFGVNVGEAIEHLGATGQEVGKELFARAQAMQELKNQTDAMRVGIDHSVEAGKAESDFKNLPDAEKANRLPSYLEEQKQLRENFRSQLTNAQAQHFFDSDSAPFLRRIIFQASSISGEGQKRYELQTQKDDLDMKMKQTEDNPYDDIGNKRREDEIVEGAKNVARYQWGYNLPDDHPIVKEEVANALSKYTLSRVQGILRDGDVEGAAAVLQANQNKIIPEAFAKMQNQIEFKSNGIITSNVVDATLKRHLKDDGSYDANVSDMQKEAVAQVEQKWPKNKTLPGLVEGLLDQRVNHARQAARIDFIENRNALRKIILDFNVQDRATLLANSNAAALLNKPGMQDVRDGLDSFIYKTRESANKITRGDTLERLNVLKNNDVEQFLNIPDFSKFPGLNTKDIIKLEGDQEDLAKNPQMGDDPRVNRAMGVLKASYGDQLRDLKVYSRTTDKKQQTAYDSMTGMLQAAISLWPADHKGNPATDDDIRETIGPQVLQHYTESTMLGLSHQEHPVFKGFRTPLPTEIPQDFREKTIRDVAAAGGAPPTPHQINQAYLKMLYNKTLKEYKEGADKSK